MAYETAIAWTDHTFNPWIGCMKVSDGCKHCYAETLVKDRMHRPGLWGPVKTTRRDRTSVANWRKPLGWHTEAQAEGKVHLVFCASLCDVFEDHPDANAARPDLFALIHRTPYLHWQLLTKRPENLAAMLPNDWGSGWPNVWLGTSVEDMRVANRVELLTQIPAAVRFISYEPALGPLDDLDISGLDWIIYGGESGPGYRPHDLAWPRAMRDRCRAEGKTFFFKQSSAYRTEMGTTLDGETIRDYPMPRLPHGAIARYVAAIRARVAHTPATPSTAAQGALSL